jgi:hypothetical protein
MHVYQDVMCMRYFYSLKNWDDDPLNLVKDPKFPLYTPRT